MKKLSDLTPEEIEILEAAGKSIVEHMKDIPLEVEGTPKSAVKYKDGSYKIKEILAGWNFFMESSYLGKKGEIIFVLSPEDAQEYEFAEFSYKVIDTVFPLAGGQLCTQSGLASTENFVMLFEETVNYLTQKRDSEAARAAAEYAQDPTFGMF